MRKKTYLNVTSAPVVEADFDNRKEHLLPVLVLLQLPLIFRDIFSQFQLFNRKVKDLLVLGVVD